MLPPIERVTAYFAEASRGALAVYVFGSEARGGARVSHDVDVAVLFDRAPDRTLMSATLTLEGELERLVGKPVDVIALNTASADLVHRVLRDGVIVLDRDPAARIRFEVARRNEYFDLEPVRRRYRRAASPPRA